MSGGSAGVVLASLLYSWLCLLLRLNIVEPYLNLLLVFNGVMLGSFSCSDILVLEVVAVTVGQSFINNQCDRQHFNYLLHRNLFVVIEDLIYLYCVSL